MNNLLIFEGHQIRKVQKDGEIWIAAIDVAEALGYERPKQAVLDIMTKNQERFIGYIWVSKLLTQGENGISQNRKMTFINLKGVIAFCLLSNLPTAIPFQRWADSVLESYIKCRDTSKESRRVLTDAIKNTGLNEAMHGFGYSNLTKLAYKFAEIEYKNDPEFRNTLSKEELKRLENIESLMGRLLENGYEYEEMKNIIPVLVNKKKVIA